MLIILDAFTLVGVKGNILNLISFLLQQREVVAMWNGTKCCRVFNDDSPQRHVLSPLLWNLIRGQLLQSLDLQPVHAQAYINGIVLLAQGHGLKALHNSITACLVLAGQWADANTLLLEDEVDSAFPSPPRLATTKVLQS